MTGPSPLDPEGTARLRVAGDERDGWRDLAASLAEHDVSDETLYLAWEVGRWASGLSAADRDALRLLVIASIENARRGSTRLPLAPRRDGGPALDAVLATLGVPARDREAAVALTARLLAADEPALASLIGGATDYKPFIVDAGCLYHHRAFVLEARLADVLARRLRAPAVAADEAAVEAAVTAALAAAAAAGPALSPEQRDAIRAALCRPLTVISGGPGTGKTSIVLGILRASVHLGIAPARVALAAPTGKAANRIDQALAAFGPERPVPRTLHRLLGYQPAAAPGRSAYRHHANAPLPHDLVVVDEGSMIDLEMLDRLLGAVRPEARLVLLGDADQLPSVESGAGFRELVAVPAAGAAILRRSFRMDPRDPLGRRILTTARALNAGRLEEADLTPRARAAEVRFEGVELLDAEAAPIERRAFLDRWVAERLRALPDPVTHDRRVRRPFHFSRAGVDAADRAELESLFTARERDRLLCITRGAGTATGAEAINAFVHQRFAAALAPHEPPAAFLPGEPVIMLRNDYERGLFNGDQGLCLRTTLDDARVETALVFRRGDGFAAFPIASLAGDVRLAYASTVHKAQGSELDHVALVLPDHDVPLLSREVVYTAVTRARRSVVIVGRRALLAEAAARPIVRASGIAERLDGVVPTGAAP